MNKLNHYQKVILITATLIINTLNCYSQSDYGWQRLNYNNENSSQNEFIGPSIIDEIIWTFNPEIEESISFFPVHNNKYVVITTNSGYAYCIDIDTSDIIWKNKYDGFDYSATISNSVVFLNVQSNERGEERIIAIDILSGKELWSFNVWLAPKSSPIIKDGFIYFAEEDENIYCLNLNTGDLVWEFGKNKNKFSLGDIEWSDLALKDNMLFCPTLNNYLYVLDIDSGSLLWMFNCRKYNSYESYQSSPILKGNNVFFSSSDSLYCIDYVNQTEKWVKEGGTSIAQASFSDKIIISYEEKSKIVCYNQDGDIEWSKDIKSMSISSSQKYLYVGDENGIVYIINPNDGSILSSRSFNSMIIGCSVYKDKLIISTEEGKVYCVSSAKN